VATTGNYYKEDVQQLVHCATPPATKVRQLLQYRPGFESEES